MMTPLSAAYDLWDHKLDLEKARLMGLTEHGADGALFMRESRHLAKSEKKQRKFQYWWPVDI